MKAARRRKCKACKGEYQPANTLQQACSPECALALVDRDNEIKAAKEKKESRSWLRRQKQALKTRGEHMKEAQQAFNAFIRARDRQRPCISCGTYNPGGDPSGGVWDCSHYRSVGACPELRFEELNAHKSCKQCNRDKSGNIVEYRINLAGYLGPETVEWLEGKHEPKKYTIQDLEKIKAYYRKQTRELERQAA